MKLRFNITFKSGQKVVAVVEGKTDVEAANLTVADVHERTIETEQFLEKLTGLRVHIEQVR